MKFIFVFGIAIGILGCSNSPTSIIIHELVVSPKALIFMHGDTTKTLSITHTCTCPFNWGVHVLTSTSVLQDVSGNGDNTKVPITIDRSKLTVDTLYSLLQITSNDYGTDTVQITIFR